MEPRLKTVPRLPRRRARNDPTSGAGANPATDAKSVQEGRWKFGRKLNFPLIIEAFSLVTAAAFVASAIGNAVFFWRAWRLNYFMIAAPSDVVMSGFVLFAGLLASLLISAMFHVVITGWAYIFNGRLGMRGRQVTGVVHVTLRGFLALPYMFAWAYTIIAIGDLTQLMKGAVRADGGFLTYPTGLKLAPTAQVDPACRGAPVLWMGSSAAIVGCERGVRVFHKLDDLVTEPLSVKRDPKEYLPPMQAAAPKAATSAPPCRNGQPECDPWEREWRAGETPPNGSVVARDGAITPPPVEPKQLSSPNHSK